MDSRPASRRAARRMGVGAALLALALGGAFVDVPRSTAAGPSVSADGRRGPSSYTVVSASGAGGEAASLAVTWPAPDVEVGEAVVVTGTSAPGDREVELQENVDGQWSRVDSVRSDPGDGSFSLAVPTEQTGQTTYRLAMYADGSGVPEAVSPQYTVTVGKSTPAPGPAPSPTPSPGPKPSPDPTGGRSVSIKVSKARVAVGGKVTMTGVVSGGRAAQRVTLLQHLADGWHPVTSSRTRRYRFSLKVPTTWYDHHRFAVRVGRSGGAAAVRSRTVTVTVVPAYRPRGGSSSHTYIGSGRWRFNPCQVLEYRVNRAGMPRGAMRDVRGAFARLSQASGLRFRYVGATRHVFGSARRPGPLNKGTELYIAWADPREVPSLSGSVVGQGGPQAWAGRDARGAVWVNEYSEVVLDRTQRMTPGFGTGTTLGQLLLHELMHALGAGHVNDTTQIMNPVMTSGPARLGAGDLAVLHDIGLAGGCIDTRAFGFRAASRVGGSR